MTVVLLLAGFVGAVAVYCLAPSDPDDALRRQIEGSKKYVREMRVIGGRANLAAAELAEWFGDRWHGRQLAGTLAVLTVGVALVFRFVALHPFDPPATGSDDNKGSPSGPA